jgi:hypothetical protein
MRNPIFLCIHAVNQGNVGSTSLLAFPDIKAADEYIRAWLEQSCGVDCYRGAEEERKLKERNGGSLPEMAFACPNLETPSDLELYHGYYYYGSGGAFQIFLMVIHDIATASKFRKEVIKEYELDKIFSDEADEMIEMLELLVRSFTEPVDYSEALTKVNLLLRQDGLNLF